MIQHQFVWLVGRGSRNGNPAVSKPATPNATNSRPENPLVAAHIMFVRAYPFDPQCQGL